MANYTQIVMNNISNVVHKTTTLPPSRNEINYTVINLVNSTKNIVNETVSLTQKYQNANTTTILYLVFGILIFAILIWLFVKDEE